MRELDRDQDGCQEEDHGVGGCRNHDGGVAAHGKGLDEVPGSEWGGIDTSEAPVLLLHVGATVLDTLAQVSGLRAEEDVKDELGTVDLIQLVGDQSLSIWVVLTIARMK